MSLLPNLSEAVAQQKHTLVHHRLEQAIRISLLSGGICVVILYVFASELMTIMYHAPEAASLLKIMAPFALFLYLQGPLQAALQALNYAKVSMMNSLIGAIIKTGAIFALASNPSLDYGCGISYCSWFCACDTVTLCLYCQNNWFLLPHCTDYKIDATHCRDRSSRQTSKRYASSIVILYCSNDHQHRINNNLLSSRYV